MSCDDNGPKLDPAAIDPSKISVRFGDYVETPVDVSVTGYRDPFPTPGIKPAQDPLTPGVPPKYDQPVPQQWFNWANVSPANADGFKALIQAQSAHVTWSKAAQCPCRLSNGDHDPNCLLCLHGMVYFDDRKVPMLVQSATLQQQYMSQGRLDSGSVIVTSLYENPISYGDRLVVEGNLIRDSELMRRSEKTRIDPLKFVAVELVMVRTKERVYNIGEDCALTEDGKLEWAKTKQNRPADGAWYSVVYLHHPVYIITDMQHHHRDRRIMQSTQFDQVVRLPIQGLAKLFQLVRDEGRDPQAVKYKNPFGK